MNNKKVYIPKEEIKLSFSRSSGAGGQNVNKVASKVTAKWSISNSNSFTEAQKALIYKKLTNRINSDGELIVVSESERSQLQNKTLAVAKLRVLVTKALQKIKKRKPTKESVSSKLRAIESQKKRASLKVKRRKTKDTLD